MNTQVAETQRSVRQSPLRPEAISAVIPDAMLRRFVYTVQLKVLVYHLGGIDMSRSCMLGKISDKDCTNKASGGPDEAIFSNIGKEALWLRQGGSTGVTMESYTPKLLGERDDSRYISIAMWSLVQVMLCFCYPQLEFTPGIASRLCPTLVYHSNRLPFPENT